MISNAHMAPLVLSFFLKKIDGQKYITQLKRSISLQFSESDEPVQPPFKLRNSKLCSVSRRMFKRLTKALIRLRVCAA